MIEDNNEVQLNTFNTCLFKLHFKRMFTISLKLEYIIVSKEIFHSAYSNHEC